VLEALGSDTYLLALRGRTVVASSPTPLALDTIVQLAVQANEDPAAPVPVKLLVAANVPVTAPAAATPATAEARMTAMIATLGLPPGPAATLAVTAFTRLGVSLASTRSDQQLQPNLLLRQTVHIVQTALAAEAAPTRAGVIVSQEPEAPAPARAVSPERPSAMNAPAGQPSPPAPSYVSTTPVSPVSTGTPLTVEARAVVPITSKPVTPKPVTSKPVTSKPVTDLGRVVATAATSSHEQGGGLPVSDRSAPASPAVQAALPATPFSAGARPSGLTPPTPLPVALSALGVVARDTLTLPEAAAALPPASRVASSPGGSTVPTPPSTSRVDQASMPSSAPRAPQAATALPVNTSGREGPLPAPIVEAQPRAATLPVASMSTLPTLTSGPTLATALPETVLLDSETRETHADRGLPLSAATLEKTMTVPMRLTATRLTATRLTATIAVLGADSLLSPATKATAVPPRVTTPTTPTTPTTLASPSRLPAAAQVGTPPPAVVPALPTPVAESLASASPLPTVYGPRLPRARISTAIPPATVAVTVAATKAATISPLGKTQNPSTALATTPAVQQATPSELAHAGARLARAGLPLTPATMSLALRASDTQLPAVARWLPPAWSAAVDPSINSPVEAMRQVLRLAGVVPAGSPAGGSVAAGPLPAGPLPATPLPARLVATGLASGADPATTFAADNNEPTHTLLQHLIRLAAGISAPSTAPTPPSTMPETSEPGAATPAMAAPAAVLAPARREELGAEPSTPAASPTPLAGDLARSSESALAGVREIAAEHLLPPMHLDDYERVIPLPMMSAGLPEPARLAITTRRTASGGTACWMRVDCALSQLGAVSVRLSASDGGPVAVTLVADPAAAAILAEALPALTSDLHTRGVVAALRVVAVDGGVDFAREVTHE
jgi:hypothetical protein